MDERFLWPGDSQLSTLGLFGVPIVVPEIDDPDLLDLYPRPVRRPNTGNPQPAGSQ
jgi:hypothetical protein